MPQITLTDGKQFEAPADKRLVLALMDEGVDILHRCGGNARCTTCRVHIPEGEPERMTQAEADRLNANHLLGQVRLSCQILCDHDMTVEPINLLHKTDLDDAGPRPEAQITPEAQWILKPNP